MTKNWFSGTTQPQTPCKSQTALMRQKLIVSNKIKKKDVKNCCFLSRIVAFCYDDIVNERDYCRDFYQHAK